MTARSGGHPRPGANHDLKEDIRAYWSTRSHTFDLSAGHRIEDRWEMPEWRRLFVEALATEGAWRLDDCHILDIACGTGEISRVVLDLGARVTAIDFSEAMLEKAQLKHAAAARENRWSGLLADAENLQWFDNDNFDHVVMRHLAWTLTDPMRAYAEWFRVLKPGGRLLVIDGDHARAGLGKRLRRWIADRLPNGRAGPATDRHTHLRIMAQLPYGQGLTADKLIADLRQSGFCGFRRPSLRPLYRRGMRGLSLSDRLRLTAADRYAIVAEKPAAP